MQLPVDDYFYEHGDYADSTAAFELARGDVRGAVECAKYDLKTRDGDARRVEFEARFVKFDSDDPLVAPRAGRRYVGACTRAS